MPIDAPTYAVAVQFHQAGAFAQAKQLYQRLLQDDPANADLRRRLGETWQALGDPKEAEAAYREALRLEPHAGALNNLGIVLMAQRRFEEAAASYEEALRLRPDYAEAHSNLGISLMEQGKLDEAVAAYRQALLLKPDHAAVANNLGMALARQGKVEQAEAAYRQSVRIRPDFAQAHFNLGNLLRAAGRRDDAAAAYREAVRLDPRNAVLHIELGILLADLGQFAEAEACHLQALRLKPDFAAAYNNLGVALMGLGRLEDAAVRYRQAIFLAPDFVEAHYNLGRAQAERGKADEALDCFERAVRLKPDAVGALNNLGNAYKDQGRLDEAIACYRKALAVAPLDAPVHSNLLFSLLYHPRLGPDEVFREHREFGRRHEKAPAAAAPPRPAGAGPRRLRIGYVSPDFREHVVSFFIEPVLASHDRARFEVCCYSDAPRPDAATRRLQGYADRWRPLTGLTDAQAADLIRGDEVDLLVDLAGHTGGNRLRMVALRPAPLQGTYLGYMGTTGLTAVDFRITDAYADPPGMTERWHTEELVRLPETGLCYQPGHTPDAAERPPALDAGRVTFGSFNNIAKVTADVVALWSRALRAAPGSQLLLKSGAGDAGDRRLREAFAANGVEEGRVTLIGRTPSRYAYLKLYHGVDVCLDPFPYNGITTTCDALWMGVPLITLAGRTSVSRQGVGLLSNVGLHELIAETPDAYVAVAARLTAQLSKLSALRSGLRERMTRSPLMDRVRFTRRLEAAYVDVRERRLSRKAL